MYSGTLIQLDKNLENDGCKCLYIDGGKVIQSFINEGRITDIIIIKILILLGEGCHCLEK